MIGGLTSDEWLFLVKQQLKAQGGKDGMETDESSGRVDGAGRERGLLDLEERQEVERKV